MLDVIEGKKSIEIKNLDKMTEKGIRAGFFEAGRHLKNELQKELLAKDKTGRVYMYKSRRHTASGSGQTPANRSGNYRRNVGYQIRGGSQMDFGVRKGAPYSLFLEVGTSKMDPRPGIGNAADSQQKNVTNALNRSLEKELLR